MLRSGIHTLIGKLSKLWRIIATAIAFTVFGLGGSLLPFIVVPILYLLPGGPMVRERRAKAYIHYIMRCFVETMRCLGILTYCVDRGAGCNSPSQLILANHPSLIDVVFLIAFIRRADCVVKSSLTQNLFTRFSIGLAGYIANDDPEKILEAAAASLERGNSLIIFPEGTRTTPGQPMELQRGAANIALRCEAPITPVVITCEPTTLTKNMPWYRIPPRRFHFTMNIRDKIPIEEFLDEPHPSIASRRLTEFLRNYFTQELASHE